MNKLKEIGNKYYQECEIVMLATEDNTALLGIDDNSGKLFKFEPKEALWGYQHLYFLSNEEIKVGNVFLNTTTNTIHICNEVNNNICSGLNHGEYHGKFECKKIIATTDTSLLKDYSEQTLNGVACLPQPSKEFLQAYIKAYNESKPITKVLVEMEGIGRMKSGGEFTPITYQLKVNSSNEITIKKVKDSWTREEVIELLSKHFIQAGSKIGLGQDVTKFTKNWIEENL